MDEAVATEDTEAVIKLINDDRGGNLYTDKQYFQAAKTAIKACRSDLLLMLLETNKVNQDAFPSLLIYAIEQSCGEAVQMLIESGAIVNSCQTETVLEAVINKGDKEMLKTLLRCNAEVLSSREGSTSSGERQLLPIFLAARAESFDMVSILIDYGADINMTNSSTGETALMQLAGWEEDNFRQVNYLLCEGANTNMVDSTGKTALSNAVEKKHWNIIDSLLDSGAKVDDMALKIASNDEDKAIFELLQRYKNIDDAVASRDIDAIIKVINKTGPAGLAEERGRIILAQAAWYGYKEIVETLSPYVSCDYPVRLDQVVPVFDNYKDSPLGAAAGKGHTEIMNVLLDQGAEASTQALGTAAGNGQAEAVSLLLGRGAQCRGTTVLAATTGLLSNYPESKQTGNEYNKVMKLLIACGVELDEEQTPWGISVEKQGTPLELAAKAGRLDIVKTLVENGASLNPSHPMLWYDSPLAHMAKGIKEEGNATMAYLLDKGRNLYTEAQYFRAAKTAIEAGRCDLLLMLLETNKVNVDQDASPSLLHYATQEGCIEAIQMLLEHGANTSIMCGSETVLEAAINEGDMDIVKTFLDHNAKVMLSKEGMGILGAYLPIFVAARNGRYDMVSILLKYGADINMTGGFYEETALIQLASGKEDNSEAVDFLLTEGADISIVDIFEKTALCHAVEKKHRKIIDALLNQGSKVDDMTLAIASNDEDKTILELLQKQKQEDETHIERDG